jgi:hypothetical protein
MPAGEWDNQILRENRKHVTAELARLRKLPDTPDRRVREREAEEALRAVDALLARDARLREHYQAAGLTRLRPGRPRGGAGGGATA